MTAPDKSGPLLETMGLTRRFGGLVAVDHVNFRLFPGEVRCLIGPNGAGKSTFFNLITSTLEPSSGSIRFNGQMITGLDLHEISRAGIARTFQVPNLFESLSVMENVRIAAQRHWESFHPLRRIDSLPLAREVELALEQVGLIEQRQGLAANLPHGQKKRLEMAIALACRPKLLLLDEPTAGMTVAETAEMSHLIKSFAGHLTILVVEHDIDFVRDIAEIVTVFHRGRILTEGSLPEIESNPTVQEIYLGQGRAVGC